MERIREAFRRFPGGVMGRGEFQISHGRGCARENPLRVFPARFPSARRSAPIRPPSPSDPNPAKRIGSESEEIPTRVQFSAKPETERWWEFLSWYGHGDSNPNASLHENLNLACLPISSCPLI